MGDICPSLSMRRTLSYTALSDLSQSVLSQVYRVGTTIITPIFQTDEWRHEKVK